MSNALLTPEEIDLKRGQLQVQLGIKEADRELRKFSFKRRRQSDSHEPRYNRQAVHQVRSDFYNTMFDGNSSGVAARKGFAPLPPLTRDEVSDGSKVVSEASDKHVDDNAAEKHGKYIAGSAMRCEAQGRVGWPAAPS